MRCSGSGRSVCLPGPNVHHASYHHDDTNVNLCVQGADPPGRRHHGCLPGRELLPHPRQARQVPRRPGRLVPQDGGGRGQPVHLLPGGRPAHVPEHGRLQAKGVSIIDYTASITKSF